MKKIAMVAVIPMFAAVSLAGAAPADAASGYSRSQFGTAWTDNNSATWGHNGCDTRNDILRRDMPIKKIKSNTRGCVVSSGIITSKYTGGKLIFVRGKTNNVDIDHKIPLKLAWDMGANQWSKEKRVKFANDPLNLIAVDAKSNRSKGDKGPGSWLPAKSSYRCTYVKDFEKVARAYGLKMKASDAAAVARIKASC